MLNPWNSQAIGLPLLSRIPGVTLEFMLTRCLRVGAGHARKPRAGMKGRSSEPAWPPGGEEARKLSLVMEPIISMEPNLKDNSVQAHGASLLANTSVRLEGAVP